MLSCAGNEGMTKKEKKNNKFESAVFEHKKRVANDSTGKYSLYFNRWEEGEVLGPVVVQSLLVRRVAVSTDGATVGGPRDKETTLLHRTVDDGERAGR